MASGPLLLAALLQLVPQAAPSVAILKLEAKNGVTADTADLLTENLSVVIRQTRRFAKVVGTRDIEQLLGFERQKQLLSCDSTSCIAEIAGALGVDYVVGGTLGKVGTKYLFNATLSNARTGDTEGKVSRKLPNEEALLDSVEEIVAELLRDSKVPLPGASTPAPVVKPAPVAAATPPPPAKPVDTPPPPVKPAEPAPSTPTVSEAPVTTEGGGAFSAGKALMIAGGVGMAATVLPVVVSLAGLVTSLVILGAFNEGMIAAASGLGAPASVAYVGGYVVFAAGIGLSLLTLAAGGAVLGTGVVLN